jgi:hypothetical protein
LQVPRLATDQALRTLDIRLAPDGNMKADLGHLRGVRREWGEKARVRYLPQVYAWLNFLSIITLKKLTKQEVIIPHCFKSAANVL